MPITNIYVCILCSLFRSKVEELAQLKDALDAVKLGHKTYGSRLTVAVVQIAQLEKQIHEITSAKIDVNR